jgi:hypothetical protein
MFEERRHGAWLRIVLEKAENDGLFPRNGIRAG